MRKGEIMKLDRMKSFPVEVQEEMKSYVYRLIDPRNGETFYVGKGKNNRVFDHAQGVVEADAKNEKMTRINEIRLAGFDVSHVIHRHGMEEKTALEVEAALIDAFPGLTNTQGGFGSDERGIMHADEIIALYAAQEADIQHKVCFICINKTALEGSLYEVTRYAWRLDPKRAERAECILSVYKGIIKDVFIAEQWLPAVTENFPGHNPVEGRYGFVGGSAPDSIKQQYIGKRIPEKYSKKGASNPIKYSY
jgi:hypothetical protein